MRLLAEQNDASPEHSMFQIMTCFNCLRKIIETATSNPTILAGRKICKILAKIVVPR